MYPQDRHYESFLMLPVAHPGDKGRVGLTLGRGKARLAGPRVRPASGALELLGMERVHEDGVTPGRAGDGCFLDLTSMAMTAVCFSSEAQRKEVMESLSGEYHFVRNGPMSLSNRPTQPTSKATVPITSQWTGASGIPTARRAGIYGADVLLGVLDTGIDADHEEFVYQTIPFRQLVGPIVCDCQPYRDVRGFDLGGHGTQTCGVIAGRNVGIAPESSLYVASVRENRACASDLIAVMLAIDWLVEQFCQVENAGVPAVLYMSVGIPAPRCTEEAQDVRDRQTLLNDVVAALAGPDMDILTVGPARNVVLETPGAQHTHAEAITVAALDSPHVEVADPECRPFLLGYGKDLYSSLERDYRGRSLYGRVSGQGMAMAYVAGIAALFRSRYPELSAMEIRDKMRQSALPVQTSDGETSGLARYVDECGCQK